MDTERGGPGKDRVSTEVSVVGRVSVVSLECLSLVESR